MIVEVDGLDASGNLRAQPGDTVTLICKAKGMLLKEHFHTLDQDLNIFTDLQMWKPTSRRLVDRSLGGSWIPSVARSPPSVWP